MINTTLKDIRAASPCSDGWAKLLAHLGKSRAEAKNDVTPLPVLTVLESNGIDDALWVLDSAVGNRMLCRLFAADCAERVLHVFERECPDNTRPREAINAARNPDATNEELATARYAAWAAACAAATARYAARARVAARDAERAAQEMRLRQYLEYGEAAAQMPWHDAT